MAERVRSILCCRSRAVADNTHSGKYEVPRPQRLQVAADVSDFTVQSSGDSRWLVAQYAPAQVWIAARQFFTDKGFSIAEERRQTGEFATARKPPRNWKRRWCATWVSRKVRRASASGSTGVQRNTSEIFVVSVKRPAGSSTDVARRKLRATRSSTACCSTSCRPV